MPEIIFNGPAGRLEGRYHPAPNPEAPVALVLHPHPQHGGTMNNKIAYALYRCFMDQGFSVLRFNFRGVGKSEGSYDEGEGELADAAAALDWLQANHPNTKGFWMAGFSFGAWIGMQLLMRRPEFQGFVSVSPPAGKYDFNFLAPCPVSGHIIQGDKDDIVDHTAVQKLADKLNGQKGITIDYKVINGAGHFFEQHLPALCHAVQGYIQNRTYELNNNINIDRLAS